MNASDKEPQVSTTTDINAFPKIQRKKSRWDRRKYKKQQEEQKKERQALKKSNYIETPNDQHLQEQILTIHHCNIMGIPLFDNFSELQVIIARLQKFQTGIFSLNEINLDTTKARVCYRIKDLIK